MIAVVTVSDTRTFETDQSGPAAIEALHELGLSDCQRHLVKDDQEQIEQLLRRLSEGSVAIFTTGGTGFYPRDVTPEATLAVIERQANGLSELMRMRGLEDTHLSHLSRGVSGILGKTLIVNLPGSPNGARSGIRAIGELLPRILEALGHPRP